jgi:hypothetical protein
VRASRKHRYAPTPYVGRNKPLVHDQRIGLAFLAVKAMVAGFTYEKLGKFNKCIVGT